MANVRKRDCEGSNFGEKKRICGVKLCKIYQNGYDHKRCCNDGFW